ncbi:MAG: RluA family pseudouridine synthase [Christensenella hongkongensis]|uniref:RluA family pseudouridine synthase n=1 Tax=Christensenella hongkongensis TaxID=270498 RepID=UPI002A74AD31|nr:RluA family pseudouridine synthase [Christensenella hongkongensis]MDY3005055.1 RluA family pseudouridine synthase [Christensenella hongkongensis]
MIKLEIEKEQEGSKVTQCVAASLPELQNLNLKKMIKTGDIKLNGCRIKKDFEVEDGDIIEVYVPVEYERFPLLDVVYEDKNILVVNKQPGTVVTCTAATPNAPELMSMVINYMKDGNEYSEESGCIPFMCFKLDIYTGGLVMFAKNAEYFEAIREAIRQRRIKRVFRAIVKGCPEYERGQFQHFYVKDDKDNYRVAKTKLRGSVPIYTRYQVVESNGIYSIIDIEPVTQYLNQERAHMEAAGFPILGDNLYGDMKANKKLGIKYQALWATTISFDTGVNNMLEYLNGKMIQTEDIDFPLVNFD